jgi:UDP:flavonoid glycosyltransferase YjiC (YdhE family)
VRIGIQTWGTEGDIRPFIGLAAGLSTAGHQVTLAVTEITNQQFGSFGERFGFSVRHVGHIDWEESRFQDLASQVFQVRNPIKRGDIIFSNFFNPVIEDLLEAAETLCAENDLLIAHFFAYPSKIAAQKQGCPWVTVLTTPLIPSRYVPPLGAPQLTQWINPLAWKFFDFILNKSMKPSIDQLYLREGIQPEQSVLYNIWRSPLLNLVSVSPALFPPPADWTDRYHLCGFLNIPEQGEPCHMSDGLKQFLEAGDPPVYVTFGSMIATDPNPQEITKLLVEAVRRAGCRAIIQSRWENIPEIPLGPHIHPVTRAPHQHVFPHCAAVVHHGGAGTTQSATAAGCPSIVVEHASDQPLWGSVLQRAGIAPRMLHRRSATPRKLAQAIRTALQDSAMNRKAKRISKKMNQENGVKRAVALIHRAIQKDKGLFSPLPFREENR